MIAHSGASDELMVVSGLVDGPVLIERAPALPGTTPPGIPNSLFPPQHRGCRFVTGYPTPTQTWMSAGHLPIALDAGGSSWGTVFAGIDGVYGYGASGPIRFADGVWEALEHEPPSAVDTLLFEDRAVLFEIPSRPPNRLPPHRDPDRRGGDGVDRPRALGRLHVADARPDRAMARPLRRERVVVQPRFGSAGRPGADRGPRPRVHERPAEGGPHAALLEPFALILEKALRSNPDYGTPFFVRPIVYPESGVE